MVDVSDLCFEACAKSPGGGGMGFGMENMRDALRRAAPGDTLRLAVAIGRVQARGRAQSAPQPEERCCSRNRCCNPPNS